MVKLTIYVGEEITAIEFDFVADSAKYVESFKTWFDLFSTLETYFNSYVWIEIKQENRKKV